MILFYGTLVDKLLNYYSCMVMDSYIERKLEESVCEREQ